MSYLETEALGNLAVSLSFAMVLGAAGFLVLRSNRKERVTWKFPVGWFAILFSALFVFPSVGFASDYLAARDFRVALADETDTSSPVIEPSTTTTLSEGQQRLARIDELMRRPSTPTTVFGYYAEPSSDQARTWAVSAVEYAETQDWRWDDRDGAVVWATAYATRLCGLMSGSLRIGGGQPSGTVFWSPEQVEADMRESIGLEGWEYFGTQWYDSLVNGLCVRR